MPLGGTQGEGECLDAEAKTGSKSWAPRQDRRSALRSPVQNRIMDWLREELTSIMAGIQWEEQEGDGREDRYVQVLWFE